MFSPSVHHERRQRLMRAVGHGLIVLRGNSALPMNYPDNQFPLVQDGSFLYCTGLTQPDLWLLLDCDTGEQRLCGPPLFLHDTIWSGPMPSVSELATACGVKLCGDFKALAAACQQAQRQGRIIHYLPAYQAEGILQFAELLGHSPAAHSQGVSPTLRTAIIALRSIKASEEIAEIRAAVALSAKVYAVLMDACRPGVTEQYLYARALTCVVEHGSREAFPTILSRRGETLHNHNHTHTLESGDLLLVDSGVVSAEGYASDVTRTFPVTRKFTSLQRDIYDLVRAAQRSAIALIKPGVPFRDCHHHAAMTIAAGLRDLGFMRGDPEEAVTNGAHALFFPHGLGHMLGLDVHDMESLGEDFVGYDAEFQRSTQFGLAGLRMAKRMQTGHVVTVEPGIYFIPALVHLWQEQHRHADFINYEHVAKVLGFGGIRLEDDVLVTEAGAEILSAAIPIEAQSIERTTP